jgi:hypothetical protein
MASPKIVGPGMGGQFMLTHPTSKLFYLVSKEKASLISKHGVDDE